ncbi:MAG: potassium channel family protein [Gammaproteobacteria bacterium]|nr:potassium channel family protein [Gammaproteobacteria bacterium]
MNKNSMAKMSEKGRLYTTISELYNGSEPRSDWFNWGLLAFDIVTILYFIASTYYYHHFATFRNFDFVIGVIYLVDYAARLYISRNRIKDVFDLVGLADLIVIFSLLLPLIVENFLFMRAIRALRLLRSYHVVRRLRKRSRYVRLHEDVIFSVINLIVFIFIVASIVYVTQVDSNPAMKNYVDALYFTVAALTTTGFGDITLVGVGGHILAVLIMIFGISLFLRLVQTIFRPGKIRYECTTCGLIRHENDAIHCKHCGAVLHITTEGGD